MAPVSPGEAFAVKTFKFYGNDSRLVLRRLFAFQKEHQQTIAVSALIFFGFTCALFFGIGILWLILLVKSDLNTYGPSSSTSPILHLSRPEFKTMTCPKCANDQPDGLEECLHCGVIFARIHSFAKPVAPGPGRARLFKECLFSIPAEENRLLLAGRFCLWLVLAAWGFRFMTAPISGEFFNQSFMHLINLPFHEAGHLFFSPFGRFLQVLGGTLGQWIIPLVITVSFLLRSDRFGASVGLWWLGQSFMDIAPYMNDARAGQLMLLGGVTGSEVEDYHDWEVILTRLGWMQHDHLIARIAFGCGIVMMLAALLWGGWVLYRQNYRVNLQ